MKRRIFLALLPAVLLAAGILWVTGRYAGTDGMWQALVSLRESVFYLGLLALGCGILVYYLTSPSPAQVKKDTPKPISEPQEPSAFLGEFSRAQTEHGFSVLFEPMREGALLIDRDANLIQCNSGALRLLSPDSNAIPKSVFSLNNSLHFRSAIRGAMKGERQESAFHVAQQSYTIIATPLCKNGEVRAVLVFILDETEKEKREALRRDFTSNVSHELKTPLTSISGFAELIGSGMTDPADTARFADTIYHEAQRLITLVGDIIRLTQLDGSEMPYDSDPVELLSVARECTERLSFVAQKQNITFHVSGDASCRVWGNRQVMEEMIYNLCDNALKYNKPNGEVWVSVTRDAPDRVMLTVRDSGIGIPLSDQDRVFERFYRVDKSHSREIGGTGLGLSIVKHAAAYHGARIALQSEEGKGTAVKVLFGDIANEKS